MNLGFYSKKLVSYSPKNLESNVKNSHERLRVLRVICQRPYFTGSGINYVNLIKNSNKKGIEQAAVFGQPAGEKNPLENLIPPERAYIVQFKNEKLENNCEVPFFIPGMSDRMPYKSTKFSDFTPEMLEMYLAAFAKKIKQAVIEFKPNIIHTHHLWLLTALVRVLYPELPVVATCHNTALRQMILSSQLNKYIIEPIRDLDRITVIGREQEQRVRRAFNINESSGRDNIFVHIGQGINTNLFLPPECNEPSNNKSIKKIVFVGKLCFSKGLPQLLEVFKEILEELNEPLKLYVVGAGEGEEKEHIVEQAKALNDSIKFLGQLNQDNLANCFRECDLFVLPSFYDGFPKVLLESLACGCKAIITDLPGIKNEIYSSLGVTNNISFIPQPSMKTIDEPFDECLFDFKSNLKKALIFQLTNKCPASELTTLQNGIRKTYSDEALFQKYLNIYNILIK